MVVAAGRWLRQGGGGGRGAVGESWKLRFEGVAVNVGLSRFRRLPLLRCTANFDAICSVVLFAPPSFPLALLDQGPTLLPDTPASLDAGIGSHSFELVASKLDPEVSFRGFLVFY